LLALVTVAEQVESKASTFAATRTIRDSELCATAVSSLAGSPGTRNWGKPWSSGVPETVPLATRRPMLRQVRDFAKR